MAVLQAECPFLHIRTSVLQAGCPFLHIRTYVLQAGCPFLHIRTYVLQAKRPFLHKRYQRYVHNVNIFDEGMDALHSVCPFLHEGISYTVRWGGCHEQGISYTVQWRGCHDERSHNPVRNCGFCEIILLNIWRSQEKALPLWRISDRRTIIF